jgi:hypothetical protein
MILKSIFRGGPADGLEEGYSEAHSPDRINIPRVDYVGSLCYYFSETYAINRQWDGLPEKDSSGRVIYFHSGSLYTHCKQRGYWTDIVESEGEVAQ